jgi:hypothetical protein
MKTLWMTAGFLAALPLAAAAQTTKEDLKKLAAAGVGDEVIVALVRAQGPSPRWSADDLAELKKAGVSDRVLQALVGPPAESAPVREVERTVERRVVVSPTYYETEPWVPASYSFASYYPGYYYPSYGYYGGYYRPFYGGWCSPGYGYGYGGYGGYYGGRWGVGIGIGLGYRWCR